MLRDQVRRRSFHTAKTLFGRDAAFSPRIQKHLNCLYYCEIAATGAKSKPWEGKAAGIAEVNGIGGAGGKPVQKGAANIGLRP